MRATGPELMLLQRPTLVELAGGYMAVLTDVRGREAVLDGGNGVPVHVPIGVSVLAGQVINRSFSAAAGTSTESCATLRAFLAQLWRRERPVRRTVILYLCLSVLLSLVGFASPLLIALGMDAASMGDVPNTLRFVVVAALVLGAHRSRFQWMRQSAVRFLEARAATTIRTALVARIVRAPLIEAERLAGGAGWYALVLAHRVVSDGISVVTTALFAVLGLGYLLIVILELPLAAAALVLVAGALVVVNGLNAPRLAEARQAAERAAERQRAELLDLVRGAPASQVAGAQRNGVRRWLRLLIEAGEKNLAQNWAERRLQIATHTAEQLAVVGLLGVVRRLRAERDPQPRVGAGMPAGRYHVLLACTSLAETMLAGAELRMDAMKLDQILRLDPPPVHALPRPRPRQARPSSSCATCTSATPTTSRGCCSTTVCASRRARRRSCAGHRAAASHSLADHRGAGAADAWHRHRRRRRSGLRADAGHLPDSDDVSVRRLDPRQPHRCCPEASRARR